MTTRIGWITLFAAGENSSKFSGPLCAPVLEDLIALIETMGEQVNGQSKQDYEYLKEEKKTPLWM